MKIVEFAEVSPEVQRVLKEAHLHPIILTCEDGTKLRGYLVDAENLFWGVRVEPPPAGVEKKD